MHHVPSLFKQIKEIQLTKALRSPAAIITRFLSSGKSRISLPHYNIPTLWMMLNKQRHSRDFPGGPAVKSLPSNAGGMGLIPGQIPPWDGKAKVSEYKGRETHRTHSWLLWFTVTSSSIKTKWKHFTPKWVQSDWKENALLGTLDKRTPFFKRNVTIYVPFCGQWVVKQTSPIQVTLTSLPTSKDVSVTANTMIPTPQRLHFSHLICSTAVLSSGMLGKGQDNGLLQTQFQVLIFSSIYV